MGMRHQRHSQAVIRSARWRRLRVEVLRRDGWKCVQCGARGRLEVDHVQPVRDYPEGAFEPGNLQCLCPACHTRKTRLESGHPPLSEDRQRWREAVSEMETERGKHTGVFRNA